VLNEDIGVLSVAKLSKLADRGSLLPHSYRTLDTNPSEGVELTGATARNLSGIKWIERRYLVDRPEVLGGESTRIRDGATECLPIRQQSFPGRPAPNATLSSDCCAL